MELICKLSFYYITPKNLLTVQRSGNHLLSVILSVKKANAKYNNMHTAAQRKIAALRRAVVLSMK